MARVKMRRHRRPFVLVSLIAILAGALPVVAMPADLDTTFSDDGIVKTDLVGADTGRSIVIQPDGRIVVAGVNNKATDTNPATRDFAIVRYNTDGTLDTAFDGDGSAIVDFGGEDEAFSLSLQADDKLVVAGRTNSGPEGEGFAVVRYNSNGTLDATFDGDGMVITDLLGVQDEASDMALQTNGRIVVAGSTRPDGADSDFALVRYNLDGSLDLTFDGDGIAITDLGGLFDVGGAVAVQADNKIVVAGSTDIQVAPGLVTPNLAVLRFNSDGSLDPTFDGDGMAVTALANGARDVALQADGRILVTGAPSFGLVRFNSDGTIDTSFDGDGLAVASFVGGSDSGHSLSIQDDGKIVVVGSKVGMPAIDVGVVRFNADGSLDSSFDGDGVLVVDLGAQEQGLGGGIQADGKVVVTGVTSLSGEHDILLLRLEGGDAPGGPPPPPPPTSVAPPGPVNTFVDDDGNIHETDIEAIFASGITMGCDEIGPRYCPDQPVSRGQMASFLVRALKLPMGAVDAFGDDEGSVHEADINTVAAAGITFGCATGLYCPDQPVSRGQMASFLTRAFALTSD